MINKQHYYKYIFFNLIIVLIIRKSILDIIKNCATLIFVNIFRNQKTIIEKNYILLKL